MGLMINKNAKEEKCFFLLMCRTYRGASNRVRKTQTNFFFAKDNFETFNLITKPLIFMFKRYNGYIINKTLVLLSHASFFLGRKMESESGIASKECFEALSLSFLSQIYKEWVREIN